jgi:hypothetical protein
MAPEIWHVEGRGGIEIRVEDLVDAHVHGRHIINVLLFLRVDLAGIPLSS